MRERWQSGSLSKSGKQWIAQWREGGQKRKARWPVSEFTRAEARAKLAALVARANSPATSSGEVTFGDFVEGTYLPFFRGKWKRRTALTNEQRIKLYLLPPYGRRRLDSVRREELRDFLNGKAQDGFSYSIVAHLRWGLRQIFRFAVAEGHLDRNPAEMLFIPREAKRPEHRVMTREEVQHLFAVCDTRERLVAKLAILAGMRPGEIFALRWKALDAQSAHVTQRIYRGEIDTPKSHHSVRKAALADGLSEAIEEWRGQCALTGPDDWVFASEGFTTPVYPYNVWRRDKLGDLGWVTFQVMRRTHSSLLRELDVAPEVRAQQMGHTVDVNQNTYTKTALESRRKAVNLLESSLKS